MCHVFPSKTEYLGNNGLGMWVDVKDIKLLCNLFVFVWFVSFCPCGIGNVSKVIFNLMKDNKNKLMKYAQ